MFDIVSVPGSWEGFFLGVVLYPNFARLPSLTASPFALLENIFDRTLITILLQAVFFGLLHFRGFPGVILGIGLNTGYGVVLGILRHASRGLLAPILAHVFADFTIAVIVMEIIDKI